MGSVVAFRPVTPAQKLDAMLAHGKLLDEMSAEIERRLMDDEVDIEHLKSLAEEHKRGVEEYQAEGERVRLAFLADSVEAARTLTSQCVAAEQSLEAAILVAAEKLKGIMSPADLDHIVAELKATDARWQTFTREYGSPMQQQQRA